MRTQFSQWGLPGAVRVDNGPPWGSSGDLPPDLALWLTGLGVQVHWNRPRHSQGNAKVERAHGVTNRWSEAAQCADAVQLQARLRWAEQVQREHYPAVAGRSRRQAYPSLTHSGRAYAPEQEAALWQVERVYALLAQGQWIRRVDKVGMISLYQRHVKVGRPYHGQTVYVRFDPATVAWRIAAPHGQQVACCPAPYLAADPIRQLQVQGRSRHRDQGA